MRALPWLVCLIAACDAGEKPVQVNTPAKPGPDVVVTRSDTAALLEYLPADTDLVIAFDIAALRRAKLWTTYSKDVSHLVVPGASGCSYDPLADTTSIVAGFVLESDVQIVVVRGLDRDKTLACPGIVKDQLTFVDGKTLVMQRAKKDGTTPDLVPQLLQSRTRLGRDTGFVTAFDAATKKLQGAIRFVSRPGSKQLAKNFDQMGTRLEQIYGAATITDRLDLRVSLAVGSLTEATNLASMLQSQRQSPQIKQMFDRFDVIAQGSTMTFEIGMTEPQLTNIVSMLRVMIPSSGG